MTPCILHEGATDRDGYGVKWFEGRKQQAHRVAWIKAYGPIPDGADVLHRCDNPPCRSIEHLFLGTRGDNNRDRAAKGRSAAGERHHSAKLTAIDVASIRALLGHGINMHEIGRRFGVDWTTIRAIRDGRSWVRGSADAP